MIIFDFLFYYLTYWFEKRSYLLTWSTPKQRASYGIGLAITTFLFAISELIYYTNSDLKDIQYAKFIFILIALGLMKLFDFIYIKKRRYESIDPIREFRFLGNISNNTRAIIAIIIVFVAFLLPLFVLMTFVPFGIDKMK